MPAAIVELQHSEYLISTDPARLDVVAVHRFISEESYWAQGRAYEVQRRAIEHSALVIGAYTAAGEQVGFARMVTDLATWAWLCDVYVVTEHRGGGLGTAMVRTIVDHPAVADIRWQFLATRDAHDLYAKFGYRALDDPARWMHRGQRNR
jgi:GNAT superfamily N-acetyltransferase